MGERRATRRAYLLGWAVQTGTTEPPHAWGRCDCRFGRQRIQGRLCDCACHGAGGQSATPSRGPLHYPHRLVARV